MRITFEKSVLEAAVNDSLCAVSEKNTYQTLECIRFRCKEGDSVCSLTTFDLNKGFVTEIPCRVEIGGNYLINANKLNRIIKFLPDTTVTLDINDKKIVQVISGKSKFELHALEGETFPNIPELDGERGFTVDSEILRKMIAQVFFAIAVTDQRPMLCGAYFTVSENKLKLVSCDGNRLAVREIDCKLGNKNKDASDLNLSFIVPGKTLSQLSRLISDEDGDLAVILARKHVIFKMENRIFFSRLIESDYIDYTRVIPKESKITAVIDRMAFISSLERASLVTEDKSLGQVKTSVKFNFEGDVLKVSSESLSGSVYDEVAIEKEGDDLMIGFNCRFFLDALKSADGEKVKLSMSGPLMGVVITAAEGNDTSDGEYLYIVSPVRLN